MASIHLARAITVAAADMADAICEDHAKRKAIQSFLEMVLWTAAASADSLKSSAWIDSSKDDKWVKTAGTVDFPIPDTISDGQFRKIVELMGTKVPQLRTMLGNQVATKPELSEAVNGILGTSSTAPSIQEPKPAVTAPAPIPEPPPKPKPKEMENLDSPPRREREMKRDELRPPVDEFEKSITDMPGLPGDPRLKK
jgi:hypothetical protein